MSSQNSMKTRSKKTKEAPRLCPEGMSIRRERSRVVKRATLETWNQVEAEGYLRYLRHEKVCPVCTAWWQHRIKAYPVKIQ